MFVKELVIRKTFTRFRLMISVWTGRKPLKEEERDGLRLPMDEELDLEADDEQDEVEDDKDPTSDIVQCFRRFHSQAVTSLLSHEGQGRYKSGPDFLASASSQTNLG